MKSFESEERRFKIYCLTPDCMNPGGGQRSTHRNVKNFSEASRLKAIEAFEGGLRINATTAYPTQAQWKRTKKDWLCPNCR